MFSSSSRLALGLLGSATAAVAVAQAAQDPAASTSASAAKPWVAPGTTGSPIDGELFHAQVLLSAHAFSPGVIDGKDGESFKLSLRSFQRARGLDASGKLDGTTRRSDESGRHRGVPLRAG